MSELTVQELSASNVSAANSLTMKPGQEQFVTPVTYSLNEAYLDTEITWARVIVREGRVVAFIRGRFDPEADREEFRSCIWRINVAADEQGHGIGRFAVETIANEARDRGFEKLFVIWEPGESGPGAFFEHQGFEVVGETEYGESIGALTL